MSNPYYTFTPRFVPFSRVKAEEVNNQFDAIVAAFDLLPPNSGSISIGTSTLGVESGSGNAYVVAMPRTRLSNSDGDEVVFKATHQNTGAATLQVDAISAVALVRYDGTAVQSGDVLLGSFYTVRYNATAGNFSIVSPALQTIVGALTYAAPSVSAALTAAAGTATTVLRSDARIAIDQAIAPTWTSAHIFTSTAINTGSLIVNTIAPAYGWLESGAAVNETRWRVVADAGIFSIQTLTDGDAAGATALSIDRTGVVVSNIALLATSVTINGAEALSTGNAFASPTASIGLAAIAGSSLTAIRSDGAPALSQAIAPTWSAKHTFTLARGASQANGIVLSNSVPFILLDQSNASANNRYWDFGVGLEQMVFRVLNDADNASSTWLAVDRTANTVDSIAFTATTVSVNGASLRDATNLFNTGTVPAARLPGTFSGFANPTASINTGTTNGTALTAMRSDAAPPLSQAIAPTWSAQHIWGTTSGSGGSSAILIATPTPGLAWKQTGAAANNQIWGIDVSSEQLHLRLFNDASDSAANIMTVDRTANTVDAVAFPATGVNAFIVGTVGSQNAATAHLRSGAVGAFVCTTGGAATPALRVQNEATSGDNTFEDFYTETAGGVQRGSITYNRAGGVVSFNTSSGRARKTNIRDSLAAGNVIDSIRVRGFEWIDNEGKMDWWVIAEELADVYPVAVMRPTSLHGEWGVDVSKLIPLLVKEIQDLRVRVAAVEGA